MKMDNHIMVDCETLSTANNACIVSIGAVQFSLSAGEVKDEIYLPIDMESYDLYPGKFDISPKSVAWWMQQDSAVLHETFNGTVEYPLPENLPVGVLPQHIRYPIFNALDELKTFCSARQYAGPTLLWSNDETADAVWLENAYRATEQAQPWSYQSHRCHRTITTVAAELGWLQEVYDANQLPEDQRHNAAADARWQAEVVLDVFNRLRS